MGGLVFHLFPGKYRDACNEDSSSNCTDNKDAPCTLIPGEIPEPLLPPIIDQHATIDFVLDRTSEEEKKDLTVVVSVLDQDENVRFERARALYHRWVQNITTVPGIMIGQKMKFKRSLCFLKYFKMASFQVHPPSEWWLAPDHCASQQHLPQH